MKINNKHNEEKMLSKIIWLLSRLFSNPNTYNMFTVPKKQILPFVIKKKFGQGVEKFSDWKIFKKKKNHEKKTIFLLNQISKVFYL
jgi:hypothetical protein